MAEVMLTPSKVTAWLACGHYLHLRGQVDRGELAVEPSGFGSFAQLVADKGLAHEQACLDRYRAEGRTVHEVPTRERNESFDAWVARVGDLTAIDADVLYQAPLVHDGMRGIADFLLRVERDGVTTFEPVDAKLARTAAKPGHVLQLCFYAEAIEAMTGARPEALHLWLGSGATETIRTDDVLPYWRRLRASVAAAVAGPAPDGEPEPCSHCTFCELEPHCTAGWRAADSLVYVAGIRSNERAALTAAGCDTLADLAKHPGDDTGVRAERLAVLVEQSALQVEARTGPEGAPPPHHIVPVESDEPSHGFELLPQPDDADVFLDFEGHPFWTVEAGLFFLFGLIEQDAGVWTYRAFWAHEQDEERTAVTVLVDHLTRRRAAHPGMHVYHYNHTERSSLESLTAGHGVAELALAELVDTGAFVDLLAVVRGSLRIGAESYSLKEVERLTTFERSHEIDQGAGAVVAYEAFMVDRDPKHLAAIATYNEDDVRATRAVRDWLVANRPADLPWRDAHLVPDPGIPELDAQIAALHAFDEGSTEHDLGDLLGYWRREFSACIAPRAVLAAADRSTTLDHPEAISGLVSLGRFPRLGANDRVLPDEEHRFRFPPQAIDGMKAKQQVIFAGPDGRIGYTSIHSLDTDDDGGTVGVNWKEAHDELVTPGAIVLNDWLSPDPKPEALNALARAVLDPTGPDGPPSAAAMALLTRGVPTFVAGGGPTGGRFTDDVDEMCRWVHDLDGTCVAVQGPPGTGKTYRGAHLAHALIMAGKRVGITAFSHSAIANFADEVYEVFKSKGDLGRLDAVRRVTGTPPENKPGLRHVTGKGPCTKAGVNLAAGTTWLFASKEMEAAPVDVLLVDEAGQLSLADALAVTRSARNLVLLGDPAQLGQVDLAAHPGVSGRSALSHVLGDEVTMPDRLGVFISETRRMHPDVGTFISDAIYDGRLTCHDSCAKQTTEFGTGLRWLRADHAGRTTASLEEAEVVWAEARRLIGTDWTNHKGEVRPLTPDDLMVVAPFNDQVAILRARLDADPVTAGTPVGTVDRFQGQQAAVVFFTMTTSSGADLTRGIEFLFSRNRLNVAISRARCLAYLVCTEELLNTRARTIDDMRRIATLCSFVDAADR